MYSVRTGTPRINHTDGNQNTGCVFWIHTGKVGSTYLVNDCITTRRTEDTFRKNPLRPQKSTRQDVYPDPKRVQVESKGDSSCITSVKGVSLMGPLPCVEDPGP